MIEIFVFGLLVVQSQGGTISTLSLGPGIFMLHFINISSLLSYAGLASNLGIFQATVPRGQARLLIQGTSSFPPPSVGHQLLLVTSPFLPPSEEVLRPEVPTFQEQMFHGGDVLPVPISTRNGVVQTPGVTLSTSAVYATNQTITSNTAL